MESEEDVNPYSGRAQYGSWKADPECSVVGESVTQPLYPGDGVRGAGWRKRKKDDQTSLLTHAGSPDSVY